MVIALASRKYVLFLAMVSLLSLPLVMLMGMSIVSVPVKPVVKTVVKPVVEPVVKPVVEPVVKYDHHGEKFLAYLPALRLIKSTNRTGKRITAGKLSQPHINCTSSLLGQNAWMAPSR
jgi:hypothetical protein